MLKRSNIIYEYDGSFEGLMCCVFESYYRKEIPLDIIQRFKAQTTFLPSIKIVTDPIKSGRVIKSIPEKIGGQVLNFIKCAFLSCISQKELYILLFLRKGYYYGPKIMTLLADEVVNKLFKAVEYLKNESHLIEGFLRFSIFNNGLAAQIEPVNYVLPIIGRHFCSRYPEEYFLIYDKNHDMVLIHSCCEYSIISAENFIMPDADEEEIHFRKLWKLFYNTIGIEERKNPKCRMNNMPKRYWKYMTEFL
ncbi:TIGR03915 family putative DNA repair protein [Clostridium sp. LBM24168]